MCSSAGEAKPRPRPGGDPGSHTLWPEHIDFAWQGHGYDDSKSHDPSAGTQQFSGVAPIDFAWQGHGDGKSSHDLSAGTQHFLCWPEHIHLDWQGHGHAKKRSHDPAAGTQQCFCFGPNHVTSLGRGTAIPLTRPLAHVSPCTRRLCLEHTEGKSSARTTSRAAPARVAASVELQNPI